MIYTLVLILIAAIVGWVLTLHYQAKLVELQMELAQKESDKIAEMGVLVQDYEQVLRQKDDEITMLRRRLG